MSLQTQAQSSVPTHFLHLVRIDDFEFYFVEIQDAIAKLKEEPDASYERITIH